MVVKVYSWYYCCLRLQIFYQGKVTFAALGVALEYKFTLKLFDDWEHDMKLYKEM